MTVLELVDHALASRARLSRICKVLGLPARTIQRWRTKLDDERRGPTAEPANKLCEEERAEILRIVNLPEYRNLSPKQLVPRLAEDGIYIGSESTFYRVLRDADQLAHRGRARPVRNKKPGEHKATGPNQVWSWDITYLPSCVRGRWYYLYVMMDVWSRKIVGWNVHEEECGKKAQLLLRAATMREGAEAGLVLHSDNGSPMKASTMLSTLQRLGVVPSFSRPHVSDDNPYSESLFRTLKYRPEYPAKPFESLKEARDWVDGFTGWYNDEHLHSSIGMVSPGDRHNGRDLQLLEARRRTYDEARAAHPERWSGQVRAWNRPEVVFLNPTSQTREKVAA